MAAWNWEQLHKSPQCDALGQARPMFKPGPPEKPASLRRRPPLWLAAAAVASGWAALYSIGRWILLYSFAPVHEDVRMTYVAAEAGQRYGWSTIYDQAMLRSLSTGFPAGQRHIDALYTYLHPPLVAWVFAPLTAFPEPVAYALW